MQLVGVDAVQTLCLKTMFVIDTDRQLALNVTRANSNSNCGSPSGKSDSPPQAPSVSTGGVALLKHCTVVSVLGLFAQGVRIPSISAP